jgi:hypothetical protein
MADHSGLVKLEALNPPEEGKVTAVDKYNLKRWDQLMREGTET